mmetsp:Transcript_16969/g.28298  ORF Transcript_16969/g.28298 Transcript_16969/m.28298 type:complete len:316 (-) Transcript_16969:502-1449(-)|eukprot:CAMPEP_0119326954 /NCGR_PEP_ID=MMETSP1333-20130426/69607_1 /TAXON_ID=418940 /ORGANISM="Scyphosphaera apsteinii, Strain RCC1455" /LENGTH=315 /DNA_ID=CAMNT_0007335399 /DNA_START=79 /DNA_END=1026 /DNA_ORIENTATION=+
MATSTAVPIQTDSDGETIYDVNDAPMLRRRHRLMTVCAIQLVGSVGITGIAMARRGRFLMMLVLQPFFIAAAVLGYFGAKYCKGFMLVSHFLGSAGLSLVLALAIIGQSLLKRSGTDLFFFALNLPMDLYMLSSSLFSIDLWRAYIKLRRELRARRTQMQEQMQVSVERLSAPGASADLGRALQRAAVADAAMRRCVEARATAGCTGSDSNTRESLLRDLRCPICLEIMTDPVLASDGFSYERRAIERWLTTHRTSPLTGGVLPNQILIPNHRLRQVIEGIGISMGRSASSGAQNASTNGQLEQPQLTAVPNSPL